MSSISSEKNAFHSQALLPGVYQHSERLEHFVSTFEKVDISHQEYGLTNVQAYAEYSKCKHGPDGSLFLDPYFAKLVVGLRNQKVLDVGCGAGPWSIYAAKNGGFVWGIDIQPEMISAARVATQA